MDGKERKDMEQMQQETPKEPTPKKETGKVIKIVVGFVVAAFVILMIIAAIGSSKDSSDTSSTKSTSNKTTKITKSDIAGNWKVESSSMKKGYSLYYVFDDDNNVKEYQTKNDNFVWYEEGTYTLSGNKLKMDVNYYTFNNDSSTEADSAFTEKATIEKKSKNKIVLTSKGKKDSYTLPMTKISDDEIKKIDDIVAQKRSDQQARVEANKPKTHTFGAGKYTCGKDFEPGTYDLIALSGSGNVFCDDEGLNEILGTDSDYATPSYKGEAFVDGDVLEIQDTLQLKLSPQE